MDDPVSLRLAIPADADAIAEVYCRCWRETYGGFLPGDLIDYVADPDEARRNWRRRLEPGNAMHAAVAEIPHGPLIGFATGGAIRELLLDHDAELTALYILRAQHGRGLGRRLMEMVMAALTQDGFRSMVALVLSSNPAVGFYRAMGGREILRQNRPFMGVPVDETAFAWTLDDR